MSALIIYMSQAGNTLSCVPTWKNGIQGVRKSQGISAALLGSFPSRCTNAAESKAQQGEFNSELKCRRQGKEAEVVAQLICKSQTYPGWWIMSCQDYMW